MTPLRHRADRPLVYVGSGAVAGLGELPKSLVPPFGLARDPRRLRRPGRCDQHVRLLAARHTR